MLFRALSFSFFPFFSLFVANNSLVSHADGCGVIFAFFFFFFSFFCPQRRAHSLRSIVGACAQNHRVWWGAVFICNVYRAVSRGS